MPEVAPANEDLRLGNTLFFGALGWIMRHEIAHVTLRHVVGVASIQAENEADRQATEWYRRDRQADPLGAGAGRAAGPRPEIELEFRAVAMGFGLDPGSRCSSLLAGRADTTHPPTAERIYRCMELLELRETARRPRFWETPCRFGSTLRATGRRLAATPTRGPRSTRPSTGSIGLSIPRAAAMARPTATPLRQRHMIDLPSLPPAQLLLLHAQLSDELRARGIVRSANNPMGDLAEYLFCKAFGWRRAGNSNANIDAIGEGEIRYQIKGRRMTRHNKSRQLSAIRDLSGGILIIWRLFGEDYRVFRAAIILYDIVVARSRFVERTNSHKFILHDDVWSAAGVRDVTGKLATVTF